jgi:hypothetical protein
MPMRMHALRSSLAAVALLAACSSYEAIGSNDLANLGRTLQAHAESTIGPGRPMARRW